VKPANNYMTGTSLAHRIWFYKNKFALTLRGDVVTNPGLYLAFSPSPVQANDFNNAFAANPNKKLWMAQGTATFDIMPVDFVTFRFEYGYRWANVPYFAGSGGTTSPDGWSDTNIGAWRPDLRNMENRLTMAVSFRL